MIVITMTKVPASLRGDLTKWCQEIQTGVYVGNVSARVRERLWERVTKNIGRGAATLVYSTNNELGYIFRTTRRDKEVVDADGIPLMKALSSVPDNRKSGFSDAFKHHRAKQFGRVSQQPPDFVTVDLETTGLSPVSHQIIAVGAVRRQLGRTDTFYRLIKLANGVTVPEAITRGTGLCDRVLAEEGVPVAEAIIDLQRFTKGLPIVGYNLSFDQGFLRAAIVKHHLIQFNNRMIDLLPIVKHVDKFCDNYKLATVLSEHGIVNEHPHNALADAQAVMGLAVKLIKEAYLKI